MHKPSANLYPIAMSNSTDQSAQVHKELVSFVLEAAPSAKLFQHPASKTSEESMEARHKASGERVTGAKALLVKLDVKDKPDVFAVIILPGFNKLDSKATKKELKERVLGFRSFRFASPEEMEQKARGMQPGKMPPFGRPIFPDVDLTFIDEALLSHKRIGFNASDFESSIIMDTDDYLKIVTSDGTFACSTE
jgi:prolyl-tRNA editing enzyme YbaK/EbsC (Cys-tRNA(Pro) deacylase)